MSEVLQTQFKRFQENIKLIDTNENKLLRNKRDMLGVEENELMIAYLSDQLVYEVRDEDLAVETIKVAGQKIEYLRKSNTVV